MTRQVSLDFVRGKFSVCTSPSNPRITMPAIIVPCIICMIITIKLKKCLKLLSSVLHFPFPTLSSMLIKY